jgi:hypothetical protein
MSFVFGTFLILMPAILFSTAALLGKEKAAQRPAAARASRRTRRPDRRVY